MSQNETTEVTVNSPQYIELKQSASLWETFIKDCKINNVSDASLDTYKKAYKSFFKYLSDKKIQNPSTDDIVNYREYLKKSHKSNTVQLYITSLKLFFKWTARNNLYPNIAEGIKGARIDRIPKKDYFPAEKVQTLLDSIGTLGESITDYRDYTMIVLMVVCGLRDTEVSNLNWGDISLKGDNWVLYVKGKGRSEKAEFVVIPEKVKSILFDYKASLKAGTRDSDPIFTSLSKHNEGGRLTTRSISRICKTRFIDAGFDSSRLTAHSLRHTSITLALKNGVALEEVQQHARHKNISTTLIYDHALKAEENKSSKATADAIFGTN